MAATRIVMIGLLFSRSEKVSSPCAATAVSGSSPDKQPRVGFDNILCLAGRHPGVDKEAHRKGCCGNDEVPRAEQRICQRYDSHFLLQKMPICGDQQRNGGGKPQQRIVCPVGHRHHQREVNALFAGRDFLGDNRAAYQPQAPVKVAQAKRCHVQEDYRLHVVLRNPGHPAQYGFYGSGIGQRMAGKHYHDHL